MQHKALIVAISMAMAALIRLEWIVPVLMHALWPVSNHHSDQDLPLSLTTDLKRPMDGGRTTCFPAHSINGVATRHRIHQTAATTTLCCSTLIKPPTSDASSTM